MGGLREIGQVLLMKSCSLNAIPETLQFAWNAASAQGADTSLVIHKPANEGWAGIYHVLVLMWQMGCFQLVNFFVCCFPQHLIDDAAFLLWWVFSSHLTEPGMMQDLGTDRERKGCFTLSAFLFLFGLYLMLGSDDLSCLFELPWFRGITKPSACKNKMWMLLSGLGEACFSHEMLRAVTVSQA